MDKRNNVSKQNKNIENFFVYCAPFKIDFYLIINSNALL
jgi:hypothetical protein